MGKSARRKVRTCIKSRNLSSSYAFQADKQISCELRSRNSILTLPVTTGTDFGRIRKTTQNVSIAVSKEYIWVVLGHVWVLLRGVLGASVLTEGRYHLNNTSVKDFHLGFHEIAAV